MRKITWSLLAGVAVLVFSGCASTSMSTGRRVEVVDTLRIAQVESAARGVGVQVYWVNYPTKVVNN